MNKLPPETVDRFPLVDVFFPDSAADSRFEPGVHQLHLVASNGVNMLCCKEDGEVFLIPLKLTAKVSARNSKHFICRYDSLTGTIIFRSVATNETASTGPVRGRPDATINLDRIAKELGLSLEELANDESPLSTSLPVKAALTCAEMQQGPAERTVDELLGLTEENDPAHALFTLDEIDVPDLDELVVEDEGDAPLDIKLDGGGHRGRVSGED
jgi:hypothetical protein